MFGSIVQRPDNIAILNGKTSVFKCELDSKKKRIDWIYIAPNAVREQQLSSGDILNISFSNRYVVNNYNEYSELKIDRTQTSDSGTYRCEETGTQTSSRADLTVIGKMDMF